MSNFKNEFVRDSFLHLLIVIRRLPSLAQLLSQVIILARIIYVHCRLNISEPIFEVFMLLIKSTAAYC